jgi:hypothetical protein
MIQRLKRLKTIEIGFCDRWPTYHRLLDLGIPCSCSTGKPLQVEIDHVGNVIQLWCVVRQVTQSRAELAKWLETCLKL